MTDTDADASDNIAPPSAYACGTCGSKGLIITDEQGVWMVYCRNGHYLVPTRSTVIIVEAP